MVAVQGVNTLKCFGLFTSGGQINSLKQKRPSKMIYIDCKFKANMLFLKIIKIEFENSIRRLSFLYYLPDIRIAWINPWSCMTSTNYVANFFFHNISYHKESLLFCKVVCSIFKYKKKKWTYKIQKKIELGEDVNFE